MKNKKLSIILIILVYLLLSASTNFVFAQGDKTTLNLKPVLEQDNSFTATIDVKNKESIGSFQGSLKISSHIVDTIKNVTVTFTEAIKQTASLATYTYENGILNLYVVSKTELTNTDEYGNTTLEIGTILIETKNKEEITITVSPLEHSFKIVGINHSVQELEINPSEQQLVFVIPQNDFTVDPTPEPNPDPTPNPNPDPDDIEKPDPNPGEDPDKKPEEDPGKGDTQEPDNNSGDNNTQKPEDDKKPEESNKPNNNEGGTQNNNQNLDNKPNGSTQNNETTKTDNKTNSKLPYAGSLPIEETILKAICITVAMLLLCIGYRLSKRK